MKLLNKLVHFITLKLIAYCERNDKVFNITGKGTSEVYLIRYLLVNTNYFNFYIHRFLRSDHDVPHDHPWDFCTYVVDGEYNEEKFEDPFGWYTTTLSDLVRKINHRPKGSFVFRKARDIHKVIVKEQVSVENKEKAPLTICLTGPRKRTWGFWEGQEDEAIKHVLIDAKFIKWTDYLGIKDDSAKRG